MVGLERYIDLWGYAVQEGHSGLRHAEDRDSLSVRVCSSDVTVQVNKRRGNSRRGPHLFKKIHAGVSTMGGPQYQVNCLPGPREPFERDTVYLAPGATDGAGGVFRQ